ncbi:hypothetical protein C8A03DRAFT_32651 [Achaetomium macrosporum]|uniref:TRP C-terminal domain-containing protein n=1 Tax=Achaetomium macrosporum TaxID=79813 RepID=A0AAN7H7X4_9PEZI|nr:hypothetical protein C8A03DRAFT_32651 [Achaetomium macrosporum]
MVRVAGTRLAPASMIAFIALTGTLIPSVTDAAYVQWIPCVDGNGGAQLQQGFKNLWPTSNRARLLPGNDSSGQSGDLLELNVRADYLGEATCAELLDDGPSDMTITLDARIRRRRDLFGNQQERLDGGVIRVHLFGDTPQLRNDVSAAARYGPITVFLLVFVSGLLATLLMPAVSVRGSSSSPLAEAEGNGGDHHEYILPGVADCLLYHSSSSFWAPSRFDTPASTSRSRACRTGRPYSARLGPSARTGGTTWPKTGIYEINGTLTGSYGPVRMDVWWNMVVIAATVTAGVAVLMLAYRFVSVLVPSLSVSLPGNKNLDRRGPLSRSAIARGTWKVLRVVLSYFLSPIVAISAYQLHNVILPAYHLALAALLIVLVMIGLTWMWWMAPSNQLWVLLLEPSKRYRLVRRDYPDEDSGERLPRKNRDIFAVIIFTLQFARGDAVGGLQFSPLSQVVGLAAIELSLLVSTAVLRPLRRPFLSVFVWSGVARLVVVALTAVFLPELDASVSVRSRVAIAILAIHAAVLVFGCAVPAAIRLASLVYLILQAPREKPQIYGLRQLRRRHDAVNDLSAAGMLSTTVESIPNATRTNSLVSYHRHSPHSLSNASSISFYLDPDSSPDALYLQAVPQQYYYVRPFRPSATTGPYSSTHSPASSTTSPTSQLGTRCPERDGSSTTATNTITLSRSANIREAPQQSSHFSSHTTISETSEPSPLPPPLAPQWSDYSFREADLYYRRGPSQCDAEDVGDDAAVLVADATEESTVRNGASSSWALITGRKRSRSVGREKAASKGFEVRRPPRPAGV